MQIVPQIKIIILIIMCSTILAQKTDKQDILWKETKIDSLSVNIVMNDFLINNIDIYWIDNNSLLSFNNHLDLTITNIYKTKLKRIKIFDEDLTLLEKKNNNLNRILAVKEDKIIVRIINDQNEINFIYFDLQQHIWNKINDYGNENSKINLKYFKYYPKLYFFQEEDFVLLLDGDMYILDSNYQRKSVFSYPDSIIIYEKLNDFLILDSSVEYKQRSISFDYYSDFLVENSISKERFPLFKALGVIANIKWSIHYDKYIFCGYVKDMNKQFFNGLMDFNSGKEIIDLRNYFRGSTVTFSPDLKHLAIITKDKERRIGIYDSSWLLEKLRIK